MTTKKQCEQPFSFGEQDTHAVLDDSIPAGSSTTGTAIETAAGTSHTAAETIRADQRFAAAQSHKRIHYEEHW